MSKLNGSLLKLAEGFKNIHFRFTGIVILLMLVFFYFFVPNPMKAIDPYNPRFSPNNFRFEDYSDICMIKEVLAKLFPKGINKKYVDYILIEVAGAKRKGNSSKEGTYQYIYTPHTWKSIFYRRTWNISITYDDADRVMTIRLPSDNEDQNVYTFYKDCKLGIHYGENWK